MLKFIYFCVCVCVDVTVNFIKTALFPTNKYFVLRNQT